MEMKTTKQIMVHNVKRAPNYWGKIRFFCFTTGPDEGPTGAETPLVAMLKEALKTGVCPEEFWNYECFVNYDADGMLSSNMM